MKTLLCTTAMALTLGMAPAFGQALQIDPGAGAPTATTAAMPELAQEDREFAAKAAQGGMAEIALGRLAAEKASSSDVKQFGLRMVEDHGKASDELKAIAQRKSLELPTDMRDGHKQLRDRLAALSGDEFDRQYIQAMVKEHREDVDLFRRQADQGKDADLKQFAASTLPTLQDHLKMAEAAARVLQPVASTTTDRPATAQGGTFVKPDASAKTASGSATVAGPKIDARLGQMTAKELIGKDVVNQRGDNIGDIENVVVGADRMLHVVIGVGGFLGFGEKEVLVPLDQLRVGKDDAIMMSDTSEEALKQMPPYSKDGFDEWPRDRVLAP